MTGPIWVAGSRRVTDAQFRGRAGDHGDDLVGDIRLHAEQPQRRTALTGRAEGAGDGVVRHLFRQRGRIHNHGVDAAGLGDQRHDGAALGRQRLVDAPRGVRAAGERDAGDRADGRPAPRRPSPAPGSRRSALAGTPAWCSSRTASAAISGVCSAGLATTALPAASAAATWPVKIASGKFQGEMQTQTPRPCRVSVLVSPVGPGSSSGWNSVRAWAA